MRTAMAGLPLAGDFFTWWTAELRALLPARLKRAAARHLSLTVEDGSAVFLREGEAGPTTLARASSDLSKHELRQVLQDRGVRHARDVVLMIPDDAILRRRAVFPSAARADLVSAVALEAQRTSPFSPADMLVGYQVRREDEKAELLDVDIFIAPAETGAALAALARNWGLDPVAIEARNAQGAVRFARHERVALKRRGGTRRTALVLLACVGLLGAAASYAVSERLERSEAELARYRAAAAAIAPAQSGLSTLADRLGAWPGTRPRVIEVLEEVSARLPESIWLRSFRIESGTVELGGSAERASTAVDLMARSPWAKQVQLIAPVTVDSATGREDFRLRFTLTESAP